MPAGTGDDPVGDMLAVLDLRETGARTREDIYTAQNQWMPHGRVFGGQVLAQCVIAASRTVPEDRAIHSAHGYFLRPGSLDLTTTLSVDRIHDGRSFSTRRTQAYQDGQPIFSMIASFQDDDPGLDHQSAMPKGLPSRRTSRPPRSSSVTCRSPSRRSGPRRPSSSGTSPHRSGSPSRASTSRARPSGCARADPARRSGAAARRLRLRERLHPPRVEPAPPRHPVGDAGPQDREPRPRDVVAPSRPGGRLVALRPGGAERRRRTADSRPAGSTPATACSSRASRRRA